MDYGEKFKEAWRMSRNIFDLASCCYDEIILHIDVEQNFISKYMDHAEKSEKINPNLNKLNKITNNIIAKLTEFPEECYFTENKKYIFDCIEECSLKSFGDLEINQITPLMAALRGIDRSVYQLCADGEMRWKSHGPLNRVREGGSAIYLKKVPSLIDKSNKIFTFRKISQVSDIGSTLYGIRIINKHQLSKNASFPEIVRVPLKYERNEALKEQVEECRLKILVLPYIPEEAFEVKRTYGSAFEIQYKECSDSAINYVQFMMDRAIKENVNIVLLPEFTADFQIVGTLQEYLKKHRDIVGRSGLIAVMAGSTYENGNNIMHILHYTGREIGTYNKYSPFTQEDMQMDSDNTFQMCEYLEKPGETCTLLDIEAVGRVLPAICRDIIDGEYTEKLVKHFLPLLVAAPAYSVSVASFEPHLRHYAEIYQASTVMCNHCRATFNKKGDNSVVSIASMPLKKGNRMKGKLYSMERQTSCDICCKGCGYLVDMKYGGFEKKDGTYAEPHIEIECISCKNE